MNLPLIRNGGAQAIFACRGRERIRAERFLREVIHLSARLPARRYMLNLCSDRYHFAVGFGAALLRHQISLLPPNHTPDFIQKLRESYPDLYCLTDRDSGDGSLETLRYPEIVEDESAGGAPPVLPAAQIAACVFTSGSSGAPISHYKTWGNLVESAQAEIERLAIGSYPDLNILSTVPPQHMYGLESTVLMAMQGGCVLHAGRPFYSGDILADLEAASRPRMLVTTPIHLRLLLAETIRLPPMDLLLCATAPLSPQLASQAERGFGAPLYEIYGCTEAGQIATRRTTQSAEWLNFRGLTLYEDDEGAWVKGGHVEGNILLNDVIELLDDTRFLLHGRTQDLVNIAGKRTSLANLNYHLNSIQGVEDGAFIVPEEDEEAVPRLMAFVVAPKLDVETLMNMLRQRVDAAFLPRPLCFVKALPRNTTGKLPRQGITQLVNEFAGKAE